MRISTARIVALAAIAIGAVSFATGSEAQTSPRPSACTTTPKAPNGYTLARIIDVAASSEGTRVVLDKGIAAKVEKGDEAYVVTCDGQRLMSGSFSVESATQTTAGGVVRMRPEELRGAYVAVDTGYDSKPPNVAGIPADYTLVRVIDVLTASDGRIRIGIGRGTNGNLSNGDKGFLLDDKGSKISGSDFEIDRLGDRTANATLNLRSQDQVRRSMLTVAVKPTKRCAVPGKKAEMGSADVASGRAAPRGYTFANVISTSVTEFSNGGAEIYVDFDRGQDDGMLPDSNAYVPTPGMGVPMPLPVDIRWVTKRTGRAVIKTTSAKVESSIKRLAIEVGSCR